MRFALPTVVVLVVLAGCVPQAAPKLHDIYLYGVLNARLSYLYGSPRTFELDGKQLTLSQGSVSAPFAVDAALLVGGKPYVRSPIAALAPAPVVVSRIPLTTDLRLRANSDVEQVVYFDGGDYFMLVDSARAGTSRRVVPRPRLNRLRGLGQLTDREADALAAALAKSGKPYVLAVLPAASLPKHSVNGTSEYLHTGVFVQRGLATGSSAAAGSQGIAWKVLARGRHAVGYDKAAYVLVANQDQLTNLWYKAYGSQLSVPPVPAIDFSRETVIAVFAGQKPTGGYGLEVRDITVENHELYVDLVKTRPQPGAITTQALTSPWMLIGVRGGGFAVAWFRNPKDGSLMAVARATQ